jgi:membrane protein
VVLEPLKRRWRALLARWQWLAVAADVQGRFNEVHGGYLASAVTLAAFLSLFPLLLVAVAVIGFFSSGHPDLNGEIVELLALPPEGDAADAVRNALQTAEQSRRAASVVGIAGLLWSGLGLVAALQYAYNSVWQVTGRGIRDKAFGLLWLAGAGVVFATSFALTALVQFLPRFLAPLNLVGALLVGTAMFLWAAKALPNRDVGWRALVPGAVLGAVGFEVLKLLGSVYVPRAVASSSALYGSIGVVFAILAWLFFFGRVVVYAATLNVVLWERSHGTTTVEVEVPSLPGRLLEQGTRDGEAVAVAE